MLDPQSHPATAICAPLSKVLYYPFESAWSGSFDAFVPICAAALRGLYGSSCTIAGHLSTCNSKRGQPSSARFTGGFHRPRIDFHHLRRAPGTRNGSIGIFLPLAKCFERSL